LKFILLNNGFIKAYSFFKKESIKLSELSEINYHYQAAVGLFVSVWELKDIYGKEIIFSWPTLGKTALLEELENQLEGFSLKNFQKLFDEGDVDDTLELWKKKGKH